MHNIVVNGGQLCHLGMGGHEKHSYTKGQRMIKGMKLSPIIQVLSLESRSRPDMKQKEQRAEKRNQWVEITESRLNSKKVRNNYSEKKRTQRSRN